MSTHNLDTEALCARVAEFMFQESVGQNWWITAQTQNKKWMHASYPENYLPVEVRRAYAQGVCNHINSAANYGGAWLVGWAFGAKKLILIWKDSDGDIQALGDCVKPWWVISEWPMDVWLDMANGIYTQWYSHMESIDRKKDQTIKLAQAIPNPKTRVRNNFKH